MCSTISNRIGRIEDVDNKDDNENKKILFKCCQLVFVFWDEDVVELVPDWPPLNSLLPCPCC